MRLSDGSFLTRTLILATAFCLGVAASPAPSYRIDDQVLIATGDGAMLSAIVVRRSDVNTRRPAALVFSIYPRPKDDEKMLRYAADRGYVGVIAYTRGKAYSPQQVVPYEHDGHDADAVISWIARQPWSDGKVGMFGGSYNGFTQWAAAKYANPALRTIVPMVPNNPGNGLPVQNGVFLAVNYPWIYYVTDNKFLDDAAYDDPRFATLNQRWYQSGRAYRDIDAIAGKPNPWLHKWLAHPSYDAYWQAMSPYRGDYARINIPVLTIAGYYGDSTAIGYIQDHRAFNPRAQDYLVAGPWDHFGTQGRVKPAVLRGYHIDPAAQIDSVKLTFDWFDYVMRGGPRPRLVQDRINYEVMGGNLWRHASSFAAMGTAQRFYITSAKLSKRFYSLSTTPQIPVSGLQQRVDLADRTTANNDSYPNPIFEKQPDVSTGFSFLSRPFSSATDVSGFDGVVHAIVNKRDVDVGLVLYEMMPDGKLFALSYFTERASLSHDMSKRALLTPGSEAVIPFVQGYLFSRRFSKGSRLLLTVNVNKNPAAEINYGSGKDVSTENVRDAGAPMRIQWLTSSYVRVRLTATSSGL
jgi:hypothetical protein